MAIEESTAVSYELTSYEMQMLEQIKDGADIMAGFLAKGLRHIHSRYPNLLMITPPMGDYAPSERLPYLGAILTAQGHKLLEKYNN
jgi:hypothetical protein